MEEDLSEFDKITILKNEVQAQYLDEVLKDRKIPHSMRNYHDSAFDGVFQNLKGWGHIEAPVEFKEEILSILHELEKKD